MVAGDANDGVNAGTGFSFQKCSALLLILANFHFYENKKYFLFFEHHDDFLFAFLNDEDELEIVDAYQSKKSSSDWGSDKELAEIISKLSVSGKNLRNDKSYPKCANYNHRLIFITNKPTNLNNGLSGKLKQKVKVATDNDFFNFINLNNTIKTNLVDKIRVGGFSFDRVELDSVCFQYVDLVDRHSSNKERLIGKMVRIFGSEVSDYPAAVDVLITMFNEAELTFNQGGQARLIDASKRITNVDINNAIGILRKEKKAYDFWRKHSVELSSELKIKLYYQRKSKEYLYNCFDYFKDLSSVEFLKILYFVRDNEHIDGDCFSEKEGVVKLYQEFIKSNKTSLQPYMVAFAIIAAYIETRSSCDSYI